MKSRCRSFVCSFMTYFMNRLPNCSSLQIGYRPFVEACIEADEKGESLKYIPKLTDPRERAEVNRAELMYLWPNQFTYNTLTLSSCLISNSLMLGLAWPRKLLMLHRRRKMVNCLVDWNWPLHRMQLLHQFSIRFVTD